MLRALFVRLVRFAYSVAEEATDEPREPTFVVAQGQDAALLHGHACELLGEDVWVVRAGHDGGLDLLNQLADQGDLGYSQ